MRLLILGATSALANEAAKLFAKDGAELVLVARSAEKLTAVKDDLLVRGAKQIEAIQTDLSDLAGHAELVEAVLKPFGGLDAVLIAYGTLGEQKQDELSVEATLREFNNNATSTISLLTLLANVFEPQKSGTIAVITSVAGDRGRQYNYIYGSAKAAVSTFLSGLRNRLASANVAVVTIKPGPVDTPMTAFHKKGPLFADAKDVGRGIYKAILKKKDVVYLPGYWKVLMAIIKSIPEGRFKKMNIGG